MKKIFNYFATIPQDKLIHSYVSLVMYVVFYEVLLLLACPNYMAFIFSFLLVAFIGGVKEIYDKATDGHDGSLMDWVADLGGAAFGVILMLL